MPTEPTDLTNYRQPGHNVWGFQNINKLLNVDYIRKPSQPSTLAPKYQNFDSFKVTGPEKKSLDLPAFLSQTETDGIVILKDGNIVFEHYDRTNTDKSIHIVFSICKSLTGLICGILAKQGKLDVEASVSTYVPEMKGSAYENVTIRQLLDMQAGVSYDDGSIEYKKASGSVQLKKDEPHTDLHTFLPTISPSTLRDGSENLPWEYLSPNADLMGWVVERAAGKKFADVVSELLWQPIGAEEDAYVTVDHGGNARTAAGLCTTTRDLARIGNLLVRGGKDIVPESWIEDMLSKGSQEAFAAGAEKELFETEFDTVSYRSFWVIDRKSQVMMASGINGQQLFVDRKHGVVMAKTSSQSERTSWDVIRLTIQAFKEFTRVLMESRTSRDNGSAGGAALGATNL